MAATPTFGGCNLATEMVTTLGHLSLRVSGTSMVPAILPGDLISIEPASVAEVAPGEIVVFAREGRLVVHRVVSRNDGGAPGLITRGDRTKRDDAVVSSMELIGRVTRIDRGQLSFLPRSQFSLAEKFAGGVLRLSDRTTSLYLRLVKRWPPSSTRR
jgi:signal peptidase I